MAQKPSIPKGTRDFSPVEVSKRNYIMSIMRSHFEKFGYQPIETPTFENSETLMGKYGEEGDRLIFKILNSGDYLEKISEEELAEKNTKKITSKISEKALRYDLTVPFARYVVQHQNEIEFPFKRYQIQPVWRADRPQKGRFREFYQCDADVVGSTSLWQEVELVQLYDAVFTDLGLGGTTIKINNRKILSGIAEVIGAKDKLIDFTVALDKLDKIGWEKVQEELMQRGFEATSIQKLSPLVNLESDLRGKLEFLKVFLKESQTGLKGVEELEEVFSLLEKMGQDLAHVEFDIMLARGLSYYTGAIFEVKVYGVSIGSVSGGGRYDNLTGVFGLPGVSGVGFSFGVDRLYDVMEELHLFPTDRLNGTKLLLAHFDQAGLDYALSVLGSFRNAGIKSEVYPEVTKIKKQLEFASKKEIPFVGICGDNEINSGTLSVKNLATGTQETLSVEAAIALLA